MKIKLIQPGEFWCNCYLCWDPHFPEAVVIDPGWAVEMILAFLKEKKLTLKAIINTHGHADHTAGDDWLREETNAPVLIHAQDAEMLADPNGNLSAWMGMNTISTTADAFMNPSEAISIGAMRFDVLATPGHTPGSVCLSCEDCLFSGDTLFAGTIGRTDLPGGNYKDIITSIVKGLGNFPDTLKIFPGHGPATHLGIERKNNPYFQL